MISVVFIDG